MQTDDQSAIIPIPVKHLDIQIAKTIYIDPARGAKITCEQCKRTKTFAPDFFSNCPDQAKVRCRCGFSFKVALEQRREVRKRINLLGSFVKLDAPFTHSGRMTVEDLSFYGVGFRLDQSKELRRNDLLKIEFVLDEAQESQIYKIDPMSRTKIVKRVIVKRVDGAYIGAEFCDPDAYAVQLKAYLDRL